MPNLELLIEVEETQLILEVEPLIDWVNISGTPQSLSTEILVSSGGVTLINPTLFDVQPNVSEIGVGVYDILNTGGLTKPVRISTPTSVNGDKYFNLSYSEDVNELGDVVISLSTFTRVFNPLTGIWEDGEPYPLDVDISLDVTPLEVEGGGR